MNVVCRRFLVLVFLASLIAARTQAADLQSATSTLKACVEKHMPDERKKQRPNVDKLLLACESEFSAVVALAQLGSKDAITELIRRQTDNKLKGGGN